MKRIICSLLIIAIVLMVGCLVACTGKEGEVVIKIDKGYDLSKGDTLVDYMEYLDEKERLDYELENGMITEINDLENGLNSYWMLYTDDPNFSNDAWGTYEYKGKTYGSATLGACSLKINKEYTYIWVYQTF